MAQPFLSQIEAFPYNFAPKNWAFCQGQLLPIQQYSALFSLLGTTYGGNGTTNFALPNLQGRVANGLGQGPGLNSYVQGAIGGEETHTLIMSEMAGPHTHTVNGAQIGAPGGTNIPSPSVVLSSAYALESGNPPENIYSTSAPSTVMQSVTPTGGQPHDNRMPFLAINYCIALSGIFPTRT
jgi:microcystin-dependent protein